jgi:cyanate lyase
MAIRGGMGTEFWQGIQKPMPPTDPLLYRFYELVLVNGPAWKALAAL